MINSSFFALSMPVRHSWIKEVLVVAFASVCIGLCGSMAIPLPFTPVPLTVQASMILFLSAMMGSQRALAAVSLFLLQGALGLPVFAHGKAGLAVFLGPTGGYLMGYLAAAFVTGWIAERMREKTPFGVFLAMGAGNLILLFFGALWLSQFVGFSSAILLGVAPFVVGDFLKLVAGARLFARVSRK